jgi:hypothetical protein
VLISLSVTRQQWFFPISLEEGDILETAHPIWGIFLRRVGSGYIFIHRLLMEHFAAMYPEEHPAD